MVTLCLVNSHEFKFPHRRLLLRLCHHVFSSLTLSSTLFIDLFSVMNSNSWCHSFLIGLCLGFNVMSTLNSEPELFCQGGLLCYLDNNTSLYMDFTISRFQWLFLSPLLFFCVRWKYYVAGCLFMMGHLLGFRVVTGTKGTAAVTDLHGVSDSVGDF